MKKILLTVMTLTGLTISLTGLAAAKNQKAADTPQPVAAVSLKAKAKAKAKKSKIAKIVFVGKKNACNCTRKRVEASWTALQKALRTPPKFPVERLQIDTQGDKVAPYHQQKPVMVLPAIYFVDRKATVLELLQGEITVAQISAALKRL